MLPYFAGHKEVRTFVQMHPTILPNVEESARIPLIKTKVFNKRKQQRIKKQQRLQKLSYY